MLDWEKFKKLPGLDADNFEKLCRSIIRRRFGRYGTWFERINQPGVEYYIQLNQDYSELGGKGEKVGWQCKWVGKKSNGELKANSRSQIVDSLNKTDKHVLGLTRWILWTPFILAKVDQDWFDCLRSKHSFQLELWSDKDIDCFLSGPALELRGAYFGDVALTLEVLEQQHRESVAPINERWIREVHQKFDVEKKIRMFLGESSAWSEFHRAGEKLCQLKETIAQSCSDSDYAGWSKPLHLFSQSCVEVIGFSNVFKQAMYSENIAPIRGMLERIECSHDTEIHSVIRQIRGHNLSLALELTNAIALIKDIKSLLKHASDYLSLSFAAVLADAGGGKTQMAAEITAPQSDRPAGILLHGKQLNKGGSLDDLAQKISFYGQTVPNFSTLLAALDAAAYRANCRLPIVIDGLNEAEVPQEWKSLLATALAMLKGYPNVLLVCTLRTGERKRSNYNGISMKSSDTRETFTQMSLPDDCVCLECEGFSDLTRDAVLSYFRHYKIEADLAKIPEDFFSHPLNLRIFCEVTNRNANNIVKIYRFPASIITLFNNQIKYVAKRISELPNLAKPYSAADVLEAIYYLGVQLWESGKRSVCEKRFLEIISSSQPRRVWDENIINLLSQEGVLFRDPGGTPFSYVLTPVYDRLGGYIIANALLAKNKNNVDDSWVNEKFCIDMLFGGSEVGHQLSQDIVHSLVALMPVVLKQQFWTVVPSSYRGKILELSTLIDAENFNSETIEAYREQILSCRIDSNTFLKLKKIRSSVDHPLNADFIHSILKNLPVSERDLSWTEFIRRYSSYVLKDIQRFEGRWKADCTARTEGDRLIAKWFSWVLTSTCIDIRYLATKALYWYGRADAKLLFKMTAESLEINDPYVSERLLSASYGVAMFYVCKGPPLVGVVSFLEQLHEGLFSESAKYYTTHLLARDYASKIIELFENKVSHSLTKEQLIDAKHPFKKTPKMEWEEKEGDSRVVGFESPFRMDFENYTIGSLVRERENYDYDNVDYKKIRAKILWRIENIGWNFDDFNEVENQISPSDRLHISSRDGPKTERYGKKYSWIAYYEMAGKLIDEGKLELFECRFDVDIDPSFPASDSADFDDFRHYLGSSNIDTGEWVSNFPLPKLDVFSIVDSIDNVQGPWVLLNGDIYEESKPLGRSFYIYIDAFLLDQNSLVKWESTCENVDFDNISKPDIEHYRYTYSGEFYQNKILTLSSEAKFEVVVGSEIKKRKQPIIKHIKNTDGSESFSCSEVETVCYETPKLEYINTYATTAKYTWNYENINIEDVHVNILTPMIFKKLKLYYDPASFEYFDSNGRLAAKNISFKGEMYRNHRELFYVRKDLIMKLIDDGLKLVWYVNGERSVVKIKDTVLDEDVDQFVNFNFYQFLL